MPPVINDIPAESAAQLIKDIAVAASDATMLDIDTTGLGAGLPETVPVLWDRARQAPIRVGDLVEPWRLWPARRRGTATVDTLQSFVDLVNRHKDEGSAIFARAAWPTPRLSAVLDYHGDRQAEERPEADARWGQHRIVYPFPLTDEFKAWMEHDKKPMNQLDFAHFLEDHAAELAAPLDTEIAEFEPLFKERFATPAVLIDLSRHLEVFVGARVKRQERLSSGERVIEFTSENRDLNGKPIDLPGIFMISVAAFVDGVPVRIPARLRYRAGGGDVVWFYQLYRAEHWLRTQVQADLAHAARETGLPRFEGEPEMKATA